MLNTSKQGSGRKTAKSQIPADKTLPKTEPCPLILPEGANDLAIIPTPPTNKLIPRNESRQYTEIEVYNPPQYEIERKSAAPAAAGLSEIEMLRKELERLRAENAQLNKERSYIEELLRRIAVLEDERAQLIEEINKLRMGKPTQYGDNDELYRTIEGLKYKIAELESANRNYQLKDSESADKIQRLTLELNDLRKGSQVTNNDMLKVLFMAEVERLHIILGDRTAEIETLRRNQQTGLSALDLDNALRNLTVKNASLEEKNVLFIVEIERLGKIVTELQQENDRLIERLSQGDLKERLRAFESEKYVLTNQIREYKLRIDEYESRLRVLEPELQQWRYKCSQLEKELEARNTPNEEELRRRLDQGQWETRYNQILVERQGLENRIIVLTQEIDRLNSANRQLQDEAIRLRFRVQELEKNPNSADIQGKLVIVTTEVDRLNMILIEKNREIDQLKLLLGQNQGAGERAVLEAEIRQLRGRVTDLETQLRYLHEENIRLSSDHRIKQSEVEQLKSSIHEEKAKRAAPVPQFNDGERGIYESQIRESKTKLLDYEGKLNLLVADTERLNNAYLIKSQEVETWREKYTRLENARLNEVQDVIAQNASLSKQVAVSNEESERLLRLFNEVERDHAAISNRYMQLSRELDQIRRTRNSYSGTTVDLTPRKAALKNELTGRIQSIGAIGTHPVDYTISEGPNTQTIRVSNLDTVNYSTK